MSPSDITTQVAPWGDQEQLTQEKAVARINEAVKKARDAGAEEAARLAVIAVGNYVWQTRDWPDLIDRVNVLLAELEGTQTRRWGKG